MLRVSARQIGYPILGFVQVKADNCLIHDYLILASLIQLPKVKSYSIVGAIPHVDSIGGTIRRNSLRSLAPYARYDSAFRALPNFIV